MTDWNLWGPPTDFISEEYDYYYDQYGLNQQFYFDERWDVIQQEALDEMYCTQVLSRNAPPVISSQETMKDPLRNLQDVQPASACNYEVEDTHCVATQIDRRVIQNSSAQDADEENAIEMVKFQNAAINAVSSSEKTSKPLIGYSKRNKKLCTSVVSKNVGKHSSMSAADVLIIEDSLSKPAERNTNLGKMTKPANAVFEDFGSSISRQSTKHRMKIVGKDDVEVIEIKDNQEHHSRDTKSGILISSSNSRDKGNFERTDKSADGIDKNVVAALRCPTDLYGGKVKTDPSLSIVDQARSSNVDLDQKICEFAPRRKSTTKGFKSVATANIFSLSSHLQIGEVKKSSPTSSFDGPQEQKRMYAAKLQVKKERKYATEETKFCVPAADEKCCDWMVRYNPKNEKQNADQLHSSFISKEKNRLKPAVSTGNVSLNNTCRDLILAGNFEHGVPSDISDFEKQRVPKLREIAKHFKVKQYYKLNKKRLLEELAELPFVHVQQVYLQLLY